MKGGVTHPSEDLPLGQARRAGELAPLGLGDVLGGLECGMEDDEDLGGEGAGLLLGLLLLLLLRGRVGVAGVGGADLVEEAGVHPCGRLLILALEGQY